MSTIAERMTAIAADLAQHEDLPIGCVLVGHRASIGVDSYRLEAIREVAQWAKKFGSGMLVTVSSYGSGTVATNVELGGELVSVDCTIHTAQAYELGRILQRELNRDVSIHIGPEELLAAIGQVVAP